MKQERLELKYNIFLLWHGKLNRFSFWENLIYLLLFIIYVCIYLIVITFFIFKLNFS